MTPVPLWQQALDARASTRRRRYATDIMREHAARGGRVDVRSVNGMGFVVLWVEGEMCAFRISEAFR